MKTKSKRSRVSGAAKSRGAGGPRPAARSPRSKPAPSANREPTVFGPVTITHPERVIYPAADVTKADMARYYDQISSWMLPHVRGRPMSLFRCPQGLGHACFFQKHYTHESPPGLHAIPIKEKEATRSYLVTDSPTGLLALVQINVVEVHLWGCTEDHLEQPDRLIFDLDPGDGVSWDQLVTAAVSIRDILAGVDLESFVKTSGGKGLHVIAPVRPSIGWDDLKEFARGIAVLLTQRNPSGYIAIMTKAKRAGRVFIDYLRNGRGATCVAPYSTRAREGATVSTPLIWKELEGLSKLPMFDLDAVLDRRGRLKTEPWADMLRTRQALSAKIRRALGVGAER